VDLDAHNDLLLVASGGVPGIGNGIMKVYIHTYIHKTLVLMYLGGVFGCVYRD
jgi:hypothetical protein